MKSSTNVDKRGYPEGRDASPTRPLEKRPERDIPNLILPLSEDQARELKIGDMVTVSGFLFTGRSRFHIRAVEGNILPPIDFTHVNGFLHAGPVMRRENDEWQVISLEPTSSIRFERYGGAVIRKLGLRAILGKTTMGPGTARALRDVGAVYLSKIGVCGNLLRQQVKRVHAVYFEKELGKTEATWVLEVERFGPFLVGMDATGGNYFTELDEAVGKGMASAYRTVGVPPDLDYTKVNAE